MSAFETIRYEVEDGAARVILDRPAVRNALDTRMRDELYEAFTAVRDDPGVRGALVAGAGEAAFCAGADLTEFGSAPSQAAARAVRRQRDLWGLLASLEKPLVAAVHGYCFGSGLELACLCDLRVAADDAVFAMPEASLGLTPAAGGTQLLPRLAGRGRALELLLSGRRFDAREALDYGIVNRIVPRAALLDEARALLLSVLAAPQAALTAAKRAVVVGADMPLAAALGMEASLAAALRGGRCA